MLQLAFLGSPAVAALGVTRFVAMYVAASVAGGLGQMSATRWQMRAAPSMARELGRRPGVGASGAVNSVIAFSILANPTATFLLFFIIPMPAWVLGTVLLFRDLRGSRDIGSSTGHAAHLMGALVGALTFAATRGLL